MQRRDIARVYSFHNLICHIENIQYERNCKIQLTVKKGNANSKPKYGTI